MPTPKQQPEENPYAALYQQELGNTESEPTANAPQTDQAPQQINSMGDMLSRTGQMFGDAAKGAVKGFGNTIRGLGNLEAKIPGLKSMMPGDVQDYLGDEGAQINTPRNTAQKLGYGGEQMAEFLAPAGLEKAMVGKAAQLAPKAAPLARVLTGALSSGAVNKVQGGSFAGGAAAGAGAGAVGEGMRAVAPAVMKNALRVGSEGLEYGRDTAKSVLDYTRGVRPGTIAKEAQDQVGAWSNDLDNMLAHSPDADLTPIRQAHDARIGKAEYRNSPTEQKLLERIREPLHAEFMGGKNTGIPLPAQIPAQRLRAIKQGVGSEVGNFSPQNQNLGAQYKKEVYGDIDAEMHRVAPGSEELDANMSSLIPAIKAGQKVETSAPMASRVLHRAQAHTGALASAVGGAFGGHQVAGVPGAIVGGTMGLLAPEVIASPEVQAGMARAMYSQTTPRVARAIGTPMARQFVQMLREREAGTGGSR